MVLRRLGLLTILATGLAFAACAEEAGDDDDTTPAGTTVTGGGTTTGAGVATGVGTGTVTGGGTTTGGGTETGAGTPSGTGTPTGSGGGATGGGSTGGGATGGGSTGGGGVGGSAVQGSGQQCDDPADVTSVSEFPTTITGTFDDDTGPFGSCITYTTPANTAWFSYTAPATGTYWIWASNASTSDPWSGLTIYDGLTCNPLGTEVACAERDAAGVILSTDLTQGNTYLIQFHTDGDLYTMVDPTISIEMESVHGFACVDPQDLTGNTEWPYQMVGYFDSDPVISGSCVTDTSPFTNAVWWTYTPGSDDEYRIVAGTSGTGPGGDSWARLAVFTGPNCNPYGAEVACSEATDYWTSVTANLSAGQDYLILLHTDGEDYLNAWPFISIESNSAEAICDDRLDNDYDDLWDCQDPTQCQSDAACVPGSTPLHGACTAHTDCATHAGNDPICLDEATFGWPGGQCMDTCTVSTNDCGAGGVCVAFQGMPDDVGMCMKLCPGGDSDCRTVDGYSCMTFGFGDVCWQ